VPSRRSRASPRSKQTGAAPLQPPEDEVSELAELRQLVETLRQSGVIIISTIKFLRRI
jgi:hypothetical protein